MTARAKPWMKFAPRRWRQDVNLRLCGAAGRAVWIELICLMHEAEPYGHLLINGRQPSEREIAVLTALPMIDVVKGLEELELNGVFSRADDGTIYSRAMVRDEELHQTWSDAGTKGAARRYQKNNEKKTPHRVGHRAPQSPPHSPPHDLESKRGESPPYSPPPSGSKRLIPDDWKPEPFGSDTQSYRIVSGWSEKRLASEVEAFKAHHGSAESRYADWQKTWSTWVLNTEKFERRDRRSSGPPADDYLAIVKAELDARDAAERPKKRAGEKV